MLLSCELRQLVSPKMSPAGELRWLCHLINESLSPYTVCFTVLTFNYTISILNQSFKPNLLSMYFRNHTGSFRRTKRTRRKFSSLLLRFSSENSIQSSINALFIYLFIRLFSVNFYCRFWEKFSCGFVNLILIRIKRNCAVPSSIVPFINVCQKS
jgi:hypothetical protein